MASRRPPDPAPDLRTGADLAARRLARIAQGLTGDGGAGAWWEDHTAVAERAEEVTEPRPVPPPDLPPVPRPGRHAARRGPAPSWARWPRTPGLRPGHVTVIALATTLALAITAWWVVRDRPTPVPSDATASLSAGDDLTPLVGDADEEGGPSTATVTVDVAGKVRRPGIVVLDEGARVTDALSAAGGARRGVDLTGLNLARVLVDGEQVVVGGPAPATTVDVPTGGTGPGGPLVNLNLAGPAELESLPEVGPVTALAIITWRDEHGGFTSVDELLEVDGIGPATLGKIAPHVTV